jgi:hypothetical protein
MHEELVKRLREEASSWCANCCYRAGDCICAAPDDRKKDCDDYTKLQAADAIEELSKYVNYIGRLKCEGWYLQQTKYLDGYQAMATMPLPEPPKEE